MSGNWRQSEICVVINDKDKSQDGTAKHLSCDGLRQTKLSFYLPVNEFLKSVNIWGSYGQEFSVLFFDSWCRTVQ